MPDRTTPVAALRDAMRTFVAERDWEQFHSPKNLAMALVAETGARLAAKGIKPHTFVSPNVPGVGKDHNLGVFDAYTEALFSRRPVNYVSA